MRLGTVKVGLEYVVDLDNEEMVQEAKNALYEDVMNAFKYNEIFQHIDVVEGDATLTEEQIPEFLLPRPEPI